MIIDIEPIEEADYFLSLEVDVLMDETINHQILFRRKNMIGNMVLDDEDDEEIDYE